MIQSDRFASHILHHMVSNIILQIYSQCRRIRKSTAVVLWYISNPMSCWSKLISNTPHAIPGKVISSFLRLII